MPSYYSKECSVQNLHLRLKALVQPLLVKDNNVWVCFEAGEKLSIFAELFGAVPNMEAYIITPSRLITSGAST